MKKDKKDDEAAQTKPVVIDFNQIQKRVIALELPAREYLALKAGTEKQLLIAEAIPNTPGVKIHTYDVAKEEAKDFSDGIMDFTTSSNGEFVLVKSKGGWMTTETKGSPKPEDNLAVSAKIKIDPQAEYEQIFKEGWRYMRDFL